MKHQIVVSLVILVSLAGQEIVAQESYTPDLTKIVEQDGWTVVNLDAAVMETDGQQYVHFTSLNQQDGIAWLDDYAFTNGTIEVDLKGKDIRGESFVGIAFRGVDMEAHDVVYFRPFNFRSPERKGHSVQYVSHPDYPWYRLREEHPDTYENTVNPVPDPNEFFHAKIVVEKPKVRVYVNGSEEPSLVVEELSDRTGGKIGLYTGYVSNGSFANLKITPVSE